MLLFGLPLGSCEGVSYTVGLAWTKESRCGSRNTLVPVNPSYLETRRTPVVLRFSDQNFHTTYFPLFQS